MRRFLSCFHSAAQTGFSREIVVLPELIAVEIAVPHLHHLLIAGIAPAPALIDRALADIDDLCVEGESRGGMMTYMTARQDKRVKKIIVGGGISDLLSCYDEREDMQQVLHDCIGGTPEEKADEYKNRSGLTGSVFCFSRTAKTRFFMNQRNCGRRR